MNVSFLLGAGFSHPAGYPLAAGVSKIVLRVQASGIATHTDGRAWLRQEFLVYLATNPTEPFKDPQDGFSHPEKGGADALEAILAVYGKTRELDNYEDFFDELYQYRRWDSSRLTDAAFIAEYERRGLHNDPKKQGEGKHIKQAVVMAFNIFSQLLDQLLQPNRGGWLPEAYSRLIQLLRKNSNRHRSIFDEVGPIHNFYFHTLNHDLFLESLLDDETAHTAIGYSDGFSEDGTPYYGRIYFGHDFPALFRKYPPYANVRIPRYTGDYEGQVQLFKLHGSLNYWSFGVQSMDAGAYEPNVVKKQPWISHLELHREFEQEGRIVSRHDFSNYSPLFLSGTTAKIEQYEDPVLFSKLLKHFSQNLADSDVLVIIGYGFRDIGINALIEPFLRDNNKKTIIISLEPPTLPYVNPEMVRLGGLEAFDFAELQQLLDAGLSS